jgi:hypothetical protein
VNATEEIKRIIEADAAIKKIKIVIADAPRNDYIAQFHLQIIKHADELKYMTGIRFCEALGLDASFGTEFSKMKKISERLRVAGVNPNAIRPLPATRNSTRPTRNTNEEMDGGEDAMNAIEMIRAAIDRAPRGCYIAEFHLQVLKYADKLRHMSGKKFCKVLGVGKAFSTEFYKMLKISGELRRAGLDPNRI